MPKYQSLLEKDAQASRSSIRKEVSDAKRFLVKIFRYESRLTYIDKVQEALKWICP